MKNLKETNCTAGLPVPREPRIEQPHEYVKRMLTESSSALILKKLSEPIDIKDIEWRVGKGVSKKNPNATSSQILGYKNARVDMNRLDEACGSFWTNEYHRDSSGVLQCGIGILLPDINQWVWRWSNGVASDIASDKGEYSDAFKRCGFMWGVGRELYSLPFIWITHKPGEKLYPNKWTWGRTSQGKLAAYEMRNGSKVVKYMER